MYCNKLCLPPRFCPFSCLNSFVGDHKDWVAEGRSEADLGTTAVSCFLYQEKLVNCKSQCGFEWFYHMATRGLSGQILSSTVAYVISGLFLMCLSCFIYPGQQGLLFLSFQNLEDKCRYSEKKRS